MKHPAILFLGAALLSAGCYKDLDLDELTTNPLDPDYSGPPLIELVGATTDIVYQDGVPTDTVLRQTARVRTEAIPDLTDWHLHVENPTEGSSADAGNGVTEISTTTHHVVPGRSYCADYSVIAQFSQARIYTYCSQAVL